MTTKREKNGKICSKIQLKSIIDFIFHPFCILFHSFGFLCLMNAIMQWVFSTLQPLNDFVYAHLRIVWKFCPFFKFSFFFSFSFFFCELKTPTFLIICSHKNVVYQKSFALAHRNERKMEKNPTQSK